MLEVVVFKDEESCRMDQLCACMEGGIEGGINSKQFMWQHNEQEEEWGLTLIDTHNTFSGEIQTSMILDFQ